VIADHEKAEKKTANDEQQKELEKLEGENSGQEGTIERRASDIERLNGRFEAQNGDVAMASKKRQVEAISSFGDASADQSAWLGNRI
jgi:predicted nuclease with TOPRIM domain